jgi:predicted nucleic acid-binding protein
LRAYFFDTSALIPRYFSGPFTYRVNRILAISNSQFFICELSIIEMSSALAKLYRKHKLSVAEFHRMRALFEDDIGSGLLKVLRVSQKDLLNARDLLEDSAVLNGRDLRSADSIIAACCRGLAHSLSRRVIFYTRDWCQYSSVFAVRAYSAALKLRYLGRGKGGVPARTG